MSDEIIDELWQIKDSIAQEHGNDVRKLSAYLQGGNLEEHSSVSSQRSAVDILAEAPGQRLFKSPEDVEAYLKDERESWER